MILVVRLARRRKESEQYSPYLNYSGNYYTNNYAKMFKILQIVIICITYWQQTRSVSQSPGKFSELKTPSIWYSDLQHSILKIRFEVLYILRDILHISTIQVIAIQIICFFPLLPLQSYYILLHFSFVGLLKREREREKFSIAQNSYARNKASWRHFNTNIGVSVQL